MPSNHHPMEPLTGLFREIVLVLGGVFAAQETDDQTVRQVAEGLIPVWHRIRSRKNRAAGESRMVPHPAIAQLLRLTQQSGLQSQPPRDDRGRLPGKAQRPRRGRSLP